MWQMAAVISFAVVITALLVSLLGSGKEEARAVLGRDHQEHDRGEAGQ